jgi:hypothetical protein
VELSKIRHSACLAVGCWWSDVVIHRPGNTDLHWEDLEFRTAVLG